MTSIISSKKSIWVKGPKNVTKVVLRTGQKGPAVEKINLNISLYLMTLGSPFYQIHLILVENLLSLYFVEVELNWETQQ